MLNARRKVEQSYKKMVKHHKIKLPRILILNTTLSKFRNVIKVFKDNDTTRA